MYFFLGALRVSYPFSLQLLVTFKDNVVTFDVTPKLADGGKRHLFKFSVKENELVSVSKYRGKDLACKIFSTPFTAKALSCCSY